MHNNHIKIEMIFIYLEILILLNSQIEQILNLQILLFHIILPVKGLEVIERIKLNLLYRNK